MKSLYTKLRRLFPCVLLLLALSGCATTNVPNTPPQVTITNTTTKTVMDALARRSIMKGAHIIDTNDYSLTVAKSNEGNFAASMLYGSRYDSVPESRVQYTAVQNGNDVLLAARAMMVTNPNSRFEKITDMTRAAHDHMQGILNEVQEDVSRESHQKR